MEDALHCILEDGAVFLPRFPQRFVSLSPLSPFIRLGQCAGDCGDEAGDVCLRHVIRCAACQCLDDEVIIRHSRNDDERNLRALVSRDL